MPSIPRKHNIVPRNLIRSTILKAMTQEEQQSQQKNRRDALQRMCLLSFFTLPHGGLQLIANAEETSDETTYESIAERASKLSSKATDITAASESAETSQLYARTSIYNFDVPVSGKQISVRDFVTRTINGEEKMPKAILIVNIKQDDPIARKNMPELITLGARFGKSGDLVIISVPSDQGYFEPDTSALIRLKLAGEYGYGINPAMQLTDKMNLLGNTAHPMMRWIQSSCRTPAGLGRIQGNFEKFLVDGQTGQPLRRYPRKYSPYDIAEDIEALIQGKQLAPPGADFQERWREAAIDSERDTYRFQKGLNYFDYQ